MSRICAVPIKERDMYGKEGEQVLEKDGIWANLTRFQPEPNPVTPLVVQQVVHTTLYRFHVEQGVVYVKHDNLGFSLCRFHTTNLKTTAAFIKKPLRYRRGLLTPEKNQHEKNPFNYLLWR